MRNTPFENLKREIQDMEDNQSVPTRFQLDNGVWCNSLKNRDGSIRSFTMGSQPYRTPNKFTQVKSVRHSLKLGITYAVSGDGFVYGVGGKFDLFECADNNVLTKAPAMETIMYRGCVLSDGVYFWLNREQLRRHLKWYFYAKYRNMFGRRVNKRIADMAVESGIKAYTRDIRIKYSVNLDVMKPNETDCIMAEESEFVGNLMKKYGCVLERDSLERKRRKLNINY
ncbi:hypothetical protein NVP1244A_030 [Vibrio phage 1.244.A._10N.261.54.C3]|nr:hypothetical protein NVP1244A_030 [Vibrio phage 1.244.A._10N.261.54.C3]AUR98658.1 hypothetical protein NVP1255O_030 [Vibrio phage 1.255.O._10N.286.45.F1]